MKIRRLIGFALAFIWFLFFVPYSYSEDIRNDIKEEQATGPFRIELEKNAFVVGEKVKINLVNNFPKKIYMYPLSVDKLVNGQWVEWRFELYCECTSWCNRAGNIINPGEKETVIYDQIGHDFQLENTGCIPSKPGKYRVSARTDYGDTWQEKKTVIYFQEFEIKAE